MKTSALLLALPLAATYDALPRMPQQPVRGRALFTTMNFFDGLGGKLVDNLKQMSDQRVARISHVMLRTDEEAQCLRTRGECCS